MNLFLQYKVGRDVVRNAAVLAPAQRTYREVQGAVWTLWSRLLDFHAFLLGSEKWKFANSPKRREFGTTSGSGTLVWQRESRKRFCTLLRSFFLSKINIRRYTSSWPPPLVFRILDLRFLEDFLWRHNHLVWKRAAGAKKMSLNSVF